MAFGSNGNFRLFAEYDDEEDNEDENSKLFLQGFSCNIYQDSEKYIDINCGKYLIPWAGDTDISIDRFDARGCFTDQTSLANAGSGSCPAPEDLDLEAELDKERYLELNENWEHEQLLEEEAQKRLLMAAKSAAAAGLKSASFNSVAFSYSSSSAASPAETSSPPPQQQLQQQQQQQQSEADDEDDSTSADEPFITPLSLDIPEGTQLPTTRRQGAIIDKTAQFLARHGAQMEIVLKTKQAANPRFKFLSYGDTLYPYYRLVLDAIRQGRYVPLVTPKPMNAAPEHAVGGGLSNGSSNNHHNYPLTLLTLPKVSTDGTSYAKLLYQFRLRQQEQLQEQQQLSQQTPPPPATISHPTVEIAAAYLQDDSLPSLQPPPPAAAPGTSTAATSAV